MKNVRTYEDLTSSLTKRAALMKSGSANGAPANGATKKAGEESGQSPEVPERDDRAKGTVAIPKDPDGAPSKATGLENKTNEEVTAPFTLNPAKTVTGEEQPKVAKLSKQAQDIAAGIRNLSATLSKKAEVGSDGKSVTPNMPPNTQVNTGTTPDAKNQPPSGGTAKGNNPDPNAKTSGAKGAGSSMNAEGTDTEKKVSLPAGDSKGNIPDSKNNTDATKGEGQAAVQSKESSAKAGEMKKESCEKCGMEKGSCKCASAKEQGDPMAKGAGADDFPIDASFHLKLASLILSTERGRQFAQEEIERAYGAEAASDLVKAASIMEERAVEMAQLEQQGAFEAEEMWKNASVEDRQKIIKVARVHSTARAKYTTDLEKMAYDAGAMMGAQMGDAGMLGGAEAGTGPDAGAAGAPAGLPPGAGGHGEPDGDEGLSPDAVVAALDEMVSSGELTPELAAEILQAIMGGGAPGGEAGGMAGAAGGAGGGMPPGAEAALAGAAGGGAGGGMPPGAAAAMGGGGAPAGGPPGKGGSEKEPKKEEPKKEESEGEKEAALLKRAHEIAKAAMQPVTAKAA